MSLRYVIQKIMVSKHGFAETAGNWTKNAMTGIDAGVKSWVVGILGYVLVQFLFMQLLGSMRKPKLPPGPRNWPLVGALFSMEANLAHWFTKLARKYGPVVYYRLGWHSVVVVSSVAAVKEVLNIKDSQFADRPNSTIQKTVAKYLTFDSQNIAMAHCDETQKMLKKVSITEIFTASKLAKYENIRRHEGTGPDGSAERRGPILSKIEIHPTISNMPISVIHYCGSKIGASMVEEISSKIQTGGRVDVKVRESLLVASTNIVCTLLFGRRLKSDSISSDTDEFREFYGLVQMQTVLALKFNVVDFVPWLERVDPQGLIGQCKDFQRISRNCFEHTIQEHRLARKSVKNFKDEDFLDVLLTLHESRKITEDTILGTLMDLVGGALDTNITTAEWALLELIKRPETLAKLQNELDEVVGRDRPVEESDFASMPYLQAVIKEIFRLHSPLPLLVPHFTKSSTSLGGFFIPANTAVFVNMYAISRDPLLWDDPEQFNPDRFMGSRHSDIIDVTGSTYQILPFGRGRRMCPGYKLGLVMVQREITTLVHAFDWSPPPGVGLDDMSVVEESGIITRPRVPLVLSARPRLTPGVYSTRMLENT